MKRNKQVEILAPAGDLKKLKIALQYGADAVYLGGTEYGLRANNINFTIDEIKTACLLAHKQKAKVYVVINIIFHNEDLENIEKYLQDLEKAKVDAVIISDPFLIDLIKQKASKLDIFLSTQQSTLNYEAALFWEKQGVKRIILGREASKKDIKQIIKKTSLEVEVFVHGAMCSAYSGRCVLSNYLTNRDSNRGGCSQICRWNFLLHNQNNNLSKKVDFSLAPKDLSLINYLPELIKMGVKSFKIEGRMRSEYYLATIVHVYRQAVEKALNNNRKIDKFNLKVLERCANREVKEQFYKTKPNKDTQYYLGREEKSNQDFLGIVLDYDKKNKEVVLEQRNFFKVGDEVEFFGPNLKCYKTKIKYIKNEKHEKIDAARHPQEIIRLPIPISLEKNDMMRTRIES